MASGSTSTTIRIRVGAVEIEVDGDIDREQLDGVLGAVRHQLPELMRDGAAPEARASAADLLARADARTFGEKAGVVAYWIEHHQGRADWRSADIVDALRDAGESAPANITDTLNQKAKKGLFEVHDRRWRLTGEGRGWVKYQLLNERESDD
ncbi:MAG: hypothetical protein AAF628_10920 [Planctomycetota bacterium]